MMQNTTSNNYDAYNNEASINVYNECINELNSFKAKYFKLGAGLNDSHAKRFHEGLKLAMSVCLREKLSMVITTEDFIAKVIEKCDEDLGNMMSVIINFHSGKSLTVDYPIESDYKNMWALESITREIIQNAASRSENFIVSDELINKNLPNYYFQVTLTGNVNQINKLKQHVRSFVQVLDGKNTNKIPFFTSKCKNEIYLAGFPIENIEGYSVNRQFNLIIDDQTNSNRVIDASNVVSYVVKAIEESIRNMDDNEILKFLLDCERYNAECEQTAIKIHSFDRLNKVALKNGWIRVEGLELLAAQEYSANHPDSHLTTLALEDIPSLSQLLEKEQEELAKKAREASVKPFVPNKWEEELINNIALIWAEKRMPLPIIQYKMLPVENEQFGFWDRKNPSYVYLHNKISLLKLKERKMAMLNTLLHEMVHYYSKFGDGCRDFENALQKTHTIIYMLYNTEKGGHSKDDFKEEVKMSYRGFVGAMQNF